MKKILSLLFSTLLVFFFVSCSDDNATGNDFPDNPETEEDIDVFIEHLETEIFNVYDAVNVLIDKYGSVDGMLSHFDEVAAIDGVSKIDTTEYTLMLKTNEGFSIFWERFPIGSLKGETAEEVELNKLMTRSVVPYEEHVVKDFRDGSKKICIVNQMSNDSWYEDRTNKYTGLYQKLKNCNYNVKYVDANNLTCEWIKNSMADYNFILFTTHGGFDGNLHWFATGESVTKSSLAKNIKNLFEGKTTISNSEKERLKRLFLIDVLNENRNGKVVEVPYLGVSELFFEITGDYKDDILFFTSCNTLKGNSKDTPNTAVADVFIDKGALAFFGYDDFTTVGHYVGHDFLCNMMLGYTIKESYNLLDKKLKDNVDYNCKPVNGGGKTYNIDTKLREIYKKDDKAKNVCIVHPEVTTEGVDVDDITPKKAILHGRIEGINTFNEYKKIVGAIGFGVSKVTILYDKDLSIVEKVDSASLSKLRYESLKTEDEVPDYDFEKEVENLESSTKYYYRAVAYFGGRYYYGEIKEFTTTTSSPDVGGGSCPHAIDLGLSVKWACCNVGAEKPEDFGNYYAWGDTIAKAKYDWKNYRWYENYSITKYTKNTKTVLEPIDDVAHVKCGGSWRMPTYEEMLELKNECKWEPKTLNGVNGVEITGPNGNSIFLPAAGLRFEEFLTGKDDKGCYWTASLSDFSDNDKAAYSLLFSFADSKGEVSNQINRNCGFSVRPVSK